MSTRQLIRVQRSDPDIGAQLRGALRGRAIVVRARNADRQFPRISSLGSDLLTTMGYLGTGTASRTVENDLQRVLPFLATAPERDVIIRDAPLLKCEGINAITLLCAAADARLWLIDAPGTSGPTHELLTAKAGAAVPVQVMLDAFGVNLVPRPRRRPGARTLGDVVVSAAQQTGQRQPTTCHDCAR